MDKPFHLLTPQEKTILRIAQNRAIDEKTKSVPPAKSSSGFTRSTPEDHVGRIIRKVKP